MCFLCRIVRNMRSDEGWRRANEGHMFKTFFAGRTTESFHPLKHRIRYFRTRIWLGYAERPARMVLVGQLTSYPPGGVRLQTRGLQSLPYTYAITDNRAIQSWDNAIENLEKYIVGKLLFHRHWPPDTHYRRRCPETLIHSSLAWYYVS